MSAPLTKDQLAFSLPNLTYVDTRLEDPVLPPPSRSAGPRGIRNWLATFRAWRRARAEIAILQAMSNTELADIGLTRCDVARVFNDNHNADLRGRNAA